jgi:hypothetical protein
MAGIPQQRRKPQDQGIILNQDHELTYCKRFGVARDRIREAIAKAAPMVKDLRQQLQGGSL